MNRHEFEITAALNNHDNLTSFGIFNFVDKNFKHIMGLGTEYHYLAKLVESGKVIRSLRQDGVPIYRLNREAFKHDK